MLSAVEGPWACKDAGHRVGGGQGGWTGEGCGDERRHARLWGLGSGNFGGKGHDSSRLDGFLIGGFGDGEQGEDATGPGWVGQQQQRGSDVHLPPTGLIAWLID